MAYIDGFVCSVSDNKKEDYIAFAKQMGLVFKKHGALRVVDAWGSDVPDGKLTSFPLAVKRKENETVVLGWIEWPSKDIRDAAWPKAMEDPLMSEGNVMPFDGKRMIFGGFDVVAES